MKKIAKYLLLATCVLLISACGNKQKTEESKEKTFETTESTMEETYKVVGVESSDSYSIKIENGTDQDIKSITIKQIEQSEYPANMLVDDQKIDKAETVQLFYTPESQDAERKYSAQITLNDDSVFELSNFDFENIDDEIVVELLRDNEQEILYLKYQDKKGEVIDTKEQEIAYKAQKNAEDAAQAQAAADAAAQADAEAAAAQEAQYDQGAHYSQDNSSSVSEPATQQPTTPAAPAPSTPAPSQDTDGCLTEPEFN